MYKWHKHRFCLFCIHELFNFAGTGLFFMWPCCSSSGISLCPSDPGRCHQEWTWSRYHTGLTVPCQMQLCHPWHQLNLLKFNGSCTVGQSWTIWPPPRAFACKSDFRGDEMDEMKSAKHALLFYDIWFVVCCSINLFLWRLSGKSPCHLFTYELNSVTMWVSVEKRTNQVWGCSCCFSSFVLICIFISLIKMCTSKCVCVCVCVCRLVCL